jgi:hypothetical protein
VSLPRPRRRGAFVVSVVAYGSSGGSSLNTFTYMGCRR